MEAKINIVEILKDKPQGTMLYSSACGKCKLEEVDDKSFKISFYNSKFGFMNGGEGYLDKNGKLYDDGECVIFPSKEMRNWSKFAWKKGDVLVGVGQRIIFEKFIDENYTKFQGKYSLSTCEDNTLVADKRCYTSNFRKLDDSRLASRSDVPIYLMELYQSPIRPPNACHLWFVCLYSNTRLARNIDHIAPLNLQPYGCSFAK